MINPKHESMRNRKSVAVLIAFISMSSFFCKKESGGNTLPAATTNGANTIGFIVKGEVWRPYYECGFLRNPCGKSSVNVASTFLNVSFLRERGKKSSQFFITTKDFKTISSTGEKIDSVFAGFDDENYTPDGVGIYNGPLPGSSYKITRYDTAAQIVSAEFYLILAENRPNADTIIIKSGRYDFKFNTCLCD
jgi:hypothetical protein